MRRINAVREEALRISNGSFYVGAGEYELFVKEGSGRLVKRLSLIHIS